MENKDTIIKTVEIDTERVFDDDETNNVSNVSEVKYVRGGTILAACSPDYEGVLEVPEGVEILGSSCFRFCSKLRKIILPSTLNVVSREAFRDMTGIQEFVVSPYNQIYSTSQDGRILFGDSQKILLKAASDIESYCVPDTVETIGGYAFQNCRNLKNIVLPDGLSSILVSAFARCSSLTSIAVPNSVEKMAARVFDCCTSLVEAKLSDSIKKLSLGVFSDCTSLESVNIPAMSKTIADEAFAGCVSLKSLYIPELVKKIDESAFVGCESLEVITVDDDNAKYSASDNVLYDKHQTKLIRCPSNYENFIVPELVSSIAKNAFNSCKNLKRVYLPPYLMKIEDYTFSNCEVLESIDIPNNVVAIKRGAFENCSKLEYINISAESSLRKIEDYAFYGCISLKKIFLPEMLGEVCSYEENGGGTFGECESLEEIDLPARIAYLNEAMFLNCKKLKTVIIPYNVQFLDSDLFFGCDSLEKVVLRNPKTEIEEGTFAPNVKIVVDEKTTYNKIYFEL